MKIEIEDKIAMAFFGLLGFALGCVFVVCIHNDMLIKNGYDKYKLEYPNSTVTFEDYKRLKG